MKIAFPTRNQEVITGHFGKMKTMVIIDVEDGAEVSREVRDMSGLKDCGGGGGCGGSGKAQFLAGKLTDCDVLIAGGMGIPMMQNIAATGIDVVMTTVKPIDEALASYLAGTLEHKPELSHAH